MPVMVAILLIIGGAVCGVLGTLHVIYTLLDMRKPRRLVPADPAVARAMANTALRLSRGRTDMWRAWIGFNFSHSLGVLLTGALAVWAGFEMNKAPLGIIMPLLILTGCVYLVMPCGTGFAVQPSASPLQPAASAPHGSCR